MVHWGTVLAEGAEIYYEMRGNGLPVLIIQGGISEAGATEQLADALAGYYRVISYDRRGLSRSTVSSDAPPTTMALHAEDAQTLLAVVADRPAYVVGASIGALIGLHLAVQHPASVTMLVAHEPPMASLVLDPQQEAALDKIVELARADVRAAIRQMALLTGNVQAEAGARPAAPVGDIDSNLRRFFAHDFPAVRNSILNADEIAATSVLTDIIPTGGRESRGQWEYRCAEQVAHKLNLQLIDMPGGHNGLVSHPRATAATLRRLFTKENLYEA